MAWMGWFGADASGLGNATQPEARVSAGVSDRQDQNPGRVAVEHHEEWEPVQRHSSIGPVPRPHGCRFRSCADPAQRAIDLCEEPQAESVALLLVPGFSLFELCLGSRMNPNGNHPLVIRAINS